VSWWESLVTLLRGGGGQTEDFTFDNLDGADRVVVTTNLNDRIKVVNDRDTVGRVIEIIKSHGSGWTVPRDGIPVADIRFNFYSGEQLLGNVGVDVEFLTAHQMGSFWSKASNRADRAALLEAVGLDERALG
jgi:hypothetical protein